MHELILENMAMVERIGRKYASRHARHPDEAVAEAYFHLVVFFTEDIRYYQANPTDYQRMLGTYVKRAVTKYFERQVRRTNELLVDKVVKNTDEEMIDFLSGLIPDDKVFEVFQLLRGGFTLYEIDMVEPLLRKAAQKVKRQVTGRIKRIEELNKAGIKTTRRIEYDRSLEAEEEEGGFPSDPSGELSRGTDSPNATGQSDQPQDSPTLGD